MPNTDLTNMLELFDKDFKAERGSWQQEALQDSGVRKQVRFSEPRKGLSAQMAINHEPGLSVSVLFLSRLKKSGTCSSPGKNSQGGSDLERTLEWHPDMIQEFWACEGDHSHTRF